MIRVFPRRRAWSLGAFALLVSLPAIALAQLPAGVTKGATVEGITEYALDNGLKVLLFPDASKPTTTVNITYLVGSRHEGYGETGMAHLLEHLSFKGTPRHSNIPQELTEHGARPNGTTWYDRTNYFETLPASDSNLVWALDLEADRMVNSFIAKKDLESEFTVVLKSGGEKKITQRVEHEYDVASPQFVRSMGVLLGPIIGFVLHLGDAGHKAVTAARDGLDVIFAR